MDLEAERKQTSLMAICVAIKGGNLFIHSFIISLNEFLNILLKTVDHHRHRHHHHHHHHNLGNIKSDWSRRETFVWHTIGIQYQTSVSSGQVVVVVGTMSAGGSLNVGCGAFSWLLFEKEKWWEFSSLFTLHLALRWSITEVLCLWDSEIYTGLKCRKLLLSFQGRPGFFRWFRTINSSKLNTGMSHFVLLFPNCIKVEAWAEAFPM